MPGKPRAAAMWDGVEIKCDTCSLAPRDGPCSEAIRGGPCDSWTPSWEAYAAANPLEGFEPSEPLGLDNSGIVFDAAQERA